MLSIHFIFLYSSDKCTIMWDFPGSNWSSTYFQFNLLFTSPGIILTHGENWRVMRRFSISALRDYGMGKKIIEDKISEECSVLTKTFETYEGELVFPPTDLAIIFQNNLCIENLEEPFQKNCQEVWFMTNCYTKLAIEDYRRINCFQYEHYLCIWKGVRNWTYYSSRLWVRIFTLSN